MPSNEPQQFMHASGPWESVKVWKCGDCGAHGDLVWMEDSAPRDHVTETGHTVSLIRSAEMTLFPVATQPPG